MSRTTHPTEAPEPEKDVISLLKQQHGEIRNLFDEVEQTSGDARKDAFRRLVQMLAVHETAEEEIIHPFAKRSIGGGEGVVSDRLEEERKAKETLSNLEKMDTEDSDFLPALLSLRSDVMEHARAEERYEFAQILRMNDPGKLAAMAKSLKAAEATAPTHPRPGVESGAKNAMLGPFAAVADRARDAIRNSRGKDG